jgi:hypothetical protein
MIECYIAMDGFSVRQWRKIVLYFDPEREPTTFGH